MSLNDKYEEELLSNWESTFKQGQLSMWIFLALKNSPCYMGEINKFIEESTNGTLKADNQSLYRSLRKYRDLEMVDYTETANNSGPDRKEYFLTPLGARVLEEFLDRNIKSVFYKKTNQDLINKEIK